MQAFRGDFTHQRKEKTFFVVAVQLSPRADCRWPGEDERALSDKNGSSRISRRENLFVHADGSKEPHRKDNPRASPFELPKFERRREDSLGSRPLKRIQFVLPGVEKVAACNDSLLQAIEDFQFL